MRKSMLMTMAIFAIISCDGLTQGASADGLAVNRQYRNAAPRRPTCPDRYSCGSLFGAYGPYGGVNYWGRYANGTYDYGTDRTYGNGPWGYRW